MKSNQQHHLFNQIDSLLYWAETMKEMFDDIQDSEGLPDYNEISWTAWLIKQRADSIREILKDDEFKQ
jgi:hypothetical protein